MPRLMHTDVKTCQNAWSMRSSERFEIHTINCSPSEVLFPRAHRESIDYLNQQVSAVQQ